MQHAPYTPFAPPPAPAPRMPRRGTFAYVAMFVTAMGAAYFLPLVTLALATHGGAGAWRAFKEGGPGMYGILFFGTLVCVGVTVAGSFVVSGTRIPGGALFAATSTPYGIGILGAIASSAMMLGAIRGESVDPSQRARILAEGISELTSSLLYGALTTSALAWGIFLMAALSPLALDRSALPETPSTPAPWVSLGALALGLVVTIGVRFALHTGISIFDALAVLGLLGAVLAAPLASRLRAVAASPDEVEGGRAFRSVLLAAVALAVALFLLNRAAISQAERTALGAVSGESLDAAQRARILSQGIAEARSRGIVGFLDAFFVLAAFAPALASGMRAKPKFGVGGVLAAVAGVVVLALLGVHTHRMSVATAAQSAESAALDDLKGVSLPPPPDDAWTPSVSSSGAPATISAAGVVLSGTIDPSGCENERKPVALGVDRGATFELLMRATSAATPPQGCAMAFVTRPEHPVNRKELGAYGGFLGPSATLFAATLQGDPRVARRPLPQPSAWEESPPEPEWLLVVAPDGDTAKVRLENVVQRSPQRPIFLDVPLGSDAPTRRRRSDALIGAAGSSQGIGTVIIAPASRDDIPRLVALVAAFGRIGESYLHAEPRVVLTSDRAWATEQTTRPVSTSGTGDGPDDAHHGGVRPGTVAVSGRLPPEVIQRIVRGSMPRMRRCYESGLARNPKLAGRVTTRFVIGRDGAVSQVIDGGSDLADKAVGECVRRAFGVLSFPEPEGGIVTVTYPITFAPN